MRFDQLFRLRLVLPNAQERFRLLLESDSEDELRDERDAQARKAGESVALKEERGDASDYAAALQFVLEEKRRWRLSSAAGVQLRMPPEPFVRPRGRRQVVLGGWVLRAAETLFWHESRGAGEGTQVDFERALGEGLLFRSTSEAAWVERRGRVELGQSLSVFQELTERDLLRYRVRLSGETEPNTHAEAHGAGVRYRRRLYSTWVFLEVEPDLAFEKANDFRGAASLRFLLETVFGAEYVDGGEAGRPGAP